MEMLQLRYFYESAQNKSFAKTAQKYMVPQTSVSAAVKRLEKELGTKLFDRASNKIALNENGELLLRSLQEIFEKLDATVARISNKDTDNRVIKMLVCAIRESVTNKIIAYKTVHPHIAFKTVFDFDETNPEDYHIIIDEKSDRYPAHECVELFTADIKLYASKDSPLVSKKLMLSDLKDQPFISIGENNGLTKILVKACQKCGFTPNFFIQGNDISCTRRCVESGVGVGVTRIDRTTQPNPNVRYLDVADFNETQTMCLYYKKSAAYGNIAHFLEFLMPDKG